MPRECHPGSGGAPGPDGHRRTCLVGQLHHLRDFLGGTGNNDGIRLQRPFIAPGPGIGDEIVVLIGHKLRADDGLQLFNSCFIQQISPYVPGLFNIQLLGLSFVPLVPAFEPCLGALVPSLFEEVVFIGFPAKVGKHCV